MSRLGPRLRDIEHARSRDGDRGQVIVLFAFSLVALLLIGALVLDVARVYTTLRYQRSVSDAAALAGAQDLQVLDGQGNPTNLPPSSSEYSRAQSDALALLVRELGGTSSPSACTGWSLSTPTCTAVVDSTYTVAITTPYSGADDPTRAVKVAISQPFHLTFGNLVCLLPGTGCASGAPSWNPGVASVAEMFKQPQYALMTLQPTTSLCTSGGLDLSVNGNNTLLNIVSGDVGTNSTACTNSSPRSSVPPYIQLAGGYYIDHFQALSGSTVDAQGNPVTWNLNSSGYPLGRKISSLINDPGYAYPRWTAAPLPYARQDNGMDASCTPPLSLTDATPTVTWTCYKPGIYSSAFNVNGSLNAYLEPGAYLFNGGLTVASGNYLAGGVQSGKEGVVLEFPTGSASLTFKTNAGAVVLLNAGDLTNTNGNIVPASSTTATPARDFSVNSDPTSPDNALIATPPMPGKPSGMVLTVMVQRDPNCFVDGGLVPQLCNSDFNSNQVVNLAGNPTLQIAGVVYGPSDNMQISANSTSQNGIVGQIVSYTISYSGGAQLNQEYGGGATNDVLRLDTVCSPGAACPSP